MDRACRRPPGSSTRYCCSGLTPKVYLISKSAGLPSGPSVRTMNRPSRLKNVEVMEPCVKRRSVKSPSTVRSEEHTSELQSLRHLVCRLLLEKKKIGGRSA